jgi:colicin import membrane protein
MKQYPGPAGMMAFSFCCHLALCVLILWCGLLPVYQKDEAPATYVDLVTLPVASPQNGTPVRHQSKEPAAAQAPTQAAAAVATQTATPAPMPKVPAKGGASKARSSSPAAEDARQFEQRLAKIERMADDKRQSEVLAQLRKGGSKTGMPGATGNEAGSDYSAYLQSRLRDAFSRELVASEMRSQMVLATITVGPEGRITFQMEKSSGDPLFDDTVVRAVTLAGRTLRPPPGGAQFKHKFRFRPDGVR